MKNKPVGWFEIYVSDMARAKAFYERVFQVNLQKIEAPDSDDVEMWAFMDVKEGPGANGSLCKMKGFEPGSNGVIVYFSCDDCAVEEKRAAEAGGRVQFTKQSIGPYGFMSLIVDTEGNMVGLHSMK